MKPQIPGWLLNWAADRADSWSDLFLSFEGRLNRKWFLVVFAAVCGLWAVGLMLLNILPPLKASILTWLIVGGVLAASLYILTAGALKRFADIPRKPYWRIAVLHSPTAVSLLFLVLLQFNQSRPEVVITLYTLLITLAIVGFLWMLSDLLFTPAGGHRR